MSPEAAIDAAFGDLLAWVGAGAPGEAGEVPLQAAVGRVLARDLVAPIDLPGADESAMDGYALRSADTREVRPRLRVVGRVLAGDGRAPGIGIGDCVRIMTGAVLPPDCDAVVPFEEVAEEAGGWVLLGTPVLPGSHVRPRGEHVSAGEVAIAAGTRLRRAHLALAAALGVASLSVLACPRVGVLSTGNELLEAPGALRRGQSFDANRPLLLAALAASGMEAIDLGICPDDPARFARCMDAAFAGECAAILVTGGAAAGDADVVRAIDGARFLSIPIRPGRGLVLARPALGPRSIPLLGLPGNAVAAYVMLHLLALPLLRRLAGETAARPPGSIPVPLESDAIVRGGRIEFRRGVLTQGPEGPRARLLAQQGSAMIRSLCEADILVALGPGPATHAGEMVRVVRIDSLEA